MKAADIDAADTIYLEKHRVSEALKKLRLLRRKLLFGEKTFFLELAKLFDERKHPSGFLKGASRRLAHGEGYRREQRRAGW
jgi:hypothetical protein